MNQKIAEVHPEHQAKLEAAQKIVRDNFITDYFSALASPPPPGVDKYKRDYYKLLFNNFTESEG